MPKDCMKIRIKPLLGGLTTLLVPPVAAAMGHRNYPRVDASYYYRTWLSHVCLAHHFGCWEAPETVLEIGPGNSLGVGLAALLSGVNKYLGYDLNSLLNGIDQQALLHEIATLYRAKAAFAEAPASLPTTDLPQQLFSVERRNYFLSQEWIEQIESSLKNRSDLIYYFNDPNEIAPNSVDYLFSQSVLEHVEDLDTMYAFMWKWLKPGGVMTHSIDFSSHGTSHEWNGHWTCPDWVWRLMKGNRLYFVNRAPISAHQALLARHGFELKGIHSLNRKSTIKRTELIPRFQTLSESDLTTTSAFLVARKPLSTHL